MVTYQIIECGTFKIVEECQSLEQAEWLIEQFKDEDEYPTTYKIKVYESSN